MHVVKVLAASFAVTRSSSAAGNNNNANNNNHAGNNMDAALARIERDAGHARAIGEALQRRPYRADDEQMPHALGRLGTYGNRIQAELDVLLGQGRGRGRGRGQGGGGGGRNQGN